LFATFETLKEEGAIPDKEALVREICRELRIHAAVEEEIFYPSVRKAIHEDDLMDEATVEHAGAKALIAQLESMRADGEMCDAKVKVLSEYIHHHVQEEQDEMFPLVRKTPLDLEALGKRMLKRKEALLAEEPSKRMSSRPG